VAESKNSTCTSLSFDGALEDFLAVEPPLGKAAKRTTRQSKPEKSKRQGKAHDQDA
jgi:hypothetical protein